MRFGFLVAISTKDNDDDDDDDDAISVVSVASIGAADDDERESVATHSSSSASVVKGEVEESVPNGIDVSHDHGTPMLCLQAATLVSIFQNLLCVSLI